MSVTNNTVSEIGDVLIIKPNVPIVGLSAISTFVDDVLGATGTRFFKKEFRYSLDGGLNFTDYIGLSPAALAAIPISASHDFKVEYKYTRDGTDPSGLLSFNNVILNGTYDIPTCGLTFDNSVYSYFFATCHEAEILDWCLNVLEKLYKPGILPRSMTRNQNRNRNQEDQDFIDLWRTVTYLFALQVAYARKFETIEKNRELLIKYLEGRGLFVCQNQSLYDLNYLKKNYYDEIRQRGTKMIAVKKGEIVHGTTVKPVDGELLRLLCYNAICDEFLFSAVEGQDRGWTVDRNSPLHRSAAPQEQLNKLFEKVVHPIDLTKYPLIGAANIGIIADATAGGNVLRMRNVAAGSSSGVGPGVTPNFDFATNIDPNIAYELSFLVARSGRDAPLTVKINGYDSSNIVREIRDVKTSAIMPIETTSLDKININGDGKYYQVRIILYPKSHTYNVAQEVTTPNINVGRNLKSTDLVCKIFPEIILDNTAGGAVSGVLRIYNLKLTPAHSNGSNAFIDGSAIIQTWTKNNNGSLTQTELEDRIRYYLLPYRSALINTQL